MSLKAIIFDLDETLLDWSGREQSWESHEEHHLSLVYEYVSERYPLQVGKLDFFDAVMQNVIQEWNSAKTSLVAPHLGRVLVKTFEGLGVPPQQLTPDMCIRAYDHQLVSGVKAYPEAASVLQQLQGYKLKFGLVTNAIQPMFARERDLSASGLGVFFQSELCLSAADVGYLKPHPHIFAEALSRLGLSANEVVFVGDNLYADIGGAQKAGMKAIWRVQSKPATYAVASEDSITPDAHIQDLTELESVLDRLFPQWR